ncbi:MAG: hypothetical protein MUE85_04585 [Microscillaceae bacterium]|jgi:drug/metabolite transporter (DMT)-like permease|nr:hypothetical protein [Microscillaceae bacterium]
MYGAGGTDGGTTRFFLGFIMLVIGGYLFLRSVHVDFGLGYHLYNYGGVGITTGYILIPMLFGIGMVFFNYRNLIGWFLTLGSLAALVFGIIVNTRFRLERMDAFQLIVILVLMVGGLGLFLSSFRSYSDN